MPPKLRLPEKKTNAHDLRAIFLLLITGAIVYMVLVSPLSLRTTNLVLGEGQVSPQDIQAPRNIEYISQVRTNIARDLAERAVVPAYTAPDKAIARKQINHLREVLDEIGRIRSESQGSFAQKIAALGQIEKLGLDEELINLIIVFSDARWEAVRNDSLRVLEQAMRSPIREENVAQRTQDIPSDVSLILSEEQSQVVVGLVAPYIVANSFFSPEMTDASRQAARASIEPVTQAYVTGEYIVQRGRVLSAANIEALQQFGLVNPSDPYFGYLGTAALVLVMMTYLAIYFYRKQPDYYFNPRSLALISFLLVFFVIAARLIIPNRAILPYVFPLPAFGLLIATLFGTGAGVVFSIAIAILAPFNATTSFDLTIFYLLSSIVGVISLGKAYRIWSFAWSAVITGVVGVAVITAYRLPAGDLDWVGYVTLTGSSMLNGFASASIAMLFQYFIAEFFGLTTSLRLLEISRSDAPLLKHFLRTAPGTYQHSLMVSNLVEQAAEKLGLDTLLVRVGALYHDVGKTTNPAFFIENQLPTNLDPHDDMTPEEVAGIVIQHVRDGIALGKKYRLPSRIIDFIAEHHGTLSARYLFNRALMQVNGDVSKLDLNKFKYPGPAPRSKETALLMLADNVEARTRSEKPVSEEDMARLVEKAIHFCQDEGQLAQSQYTLGDLDLIKGAFITTLTGLYHPRIAYPNPEPPQLVETV